MNAITFFNLFFLLLNGIVFLVGAIKFGLLYQKVNKNSPHTLGIMLICYLFMTINLLAFGLILGHWLKTH